MQFLMAGILDRSARREDTFRMLSDLCQRISASDDWRVVYAGLGILAEAWTLTLTLILTLTSTLIADCERCGSGTGAARSGFLWVTKDPKGPPTLGAQGIPRVDLHGQCRGHAGLAEEARGGHHWRHLVASPVENSPVLHRNPPRHT